MTLMHRYGLPGLLGLCALLTLGLLVWPAGVADPLGPPKADRYAGPDIETRRGGPAVGFALRLAGPDTAPEVASPPEALPVLVGIAGRRAYLRSAATGEVERVSIGQTIDGWQLVSVGTRSANLRGAKGDKRVEMFNVATGASSPVAPSPDDPSQPISGG